MLPQREIPPNRSPNIIPFRVVRRDAELLSDPDGPSPDWTLRQFYKEFFDPYYLTPKGRKPRTLKLYGEILDFWESYFPENPTLGEIDGNQSYVRDFVLKLSKRPGLKEKYIVENTIRKHCTHLQKLLDFAGPKNRKNRNAACVMHDVPYLERPDKVKEDPNDDFTLEEIGLWLGACRFAQTTRNIRRIRPETYCKSLIIFIYNTGLRINTVMHLVEAPRQGDPRAGRTLRFPHAPGRNG